jgi:hypothetical protein
MSFSEGSADDYCAKCKGSQCNTKQDSRAKVANGYAVYVRGDVVPPLPHQDNNVRLIFNWRKTT